MSASPAAPMPGCAAGRTCPMSRRPWSGRGRTWRPRPPSSSAVEIPVIVAGRISDFDVAETAGGRGPGGYGRHGPRADRRPECDRQGPSPGRCKTVTPCIGGNECHYGRAVACAANPSAGREAEMEIMPTADTPAHPGHRRRPRRAGMRRRGGRARTPCRAGRSPPRAGRFADPAGRGFPAGRLRQVSRPICAGGLRKLGVELRLSVEADVDLVRAIDARRHRDRDRRRIR